jgi:nucleotide-binding universal stress UspA family protein
MLSPFQQVLVHLDATPAAGRRLALAREIAGLHGGALCAHYAVTPFLAAMPPEAADLAVTLMELEDERRARTRQMFDEMLRTPGPPAGWSQFVDVQAEWGFQQQALYADLLVLGQHNPEDEGAAAGAVSPDFVERTVVASGRPALVVPYVGCRRPGESVAIAWKPTREAARAVTLALPFLRRATRVDVLCWGVDEDQDSGVQGDRLDLDGYLRRHGVGATWHPQGREPDRIGEMLLSRLADLGTDLLVMGCYGHSRAREWVLGGVSRTMLRSMTVPVFMAH